MADQQLVAYVRDARASGMKDEEISAVLKEQGWNEVDIAAAFSAAVAPPPAKVASPAPGVSVAVHPVSGPASSAVVKTVSKKHYLAYVNIFLILLVVGGGTAYAYNAGLIPFISGAPYSRADVVGKGLLKLTDIETATYELGFSFKDEARDPKARAFSYDKKKVKEEIEAKRPAYERDYSLVQALGTITNLLSSYSYSMGGAYPARLTDLKAWEEDRGSYYSYYNQFSDQLDKVSYARGSDKKSYTLTVTLETDQAVNAVENSAKYSSVKPVISGKKVTLTEKNNYFYSYGISQTPAKPPVVEFVENRDMTLSYLPTDMNIGATVAGTLRVTPVAGSEKTLFGGSASVSLDAKAEFGDSAYMLGFDLRLLSDAAYLKLNKFPSIPFMPYDFGAVKGQWIEINKDNAVDYFGISPLEYDELSEGQRAFEEAAEIYSKIGQIVAEEKLIVAESGPKKEKVGDRTGYKFTFGIDREKILPTYRRIITEVVSKYEESMGKAEVDAEFVTFVESDLFKDFFEHLRQNNEFAIWFDKEGFPIKVSYLSRIIPLDDTVKLKNKQFLLNLTYTLSDINQPITVQKPAEFIEFGKASELITGEVLSSARTKGANAAIKANLANMRAQAELQYDENEAKKRGSGYGAVFTEAECPIEKKGTSVFSNQTMLMMLESAITVSKSGNQQSRCGANAKSWAAAVELIPEDEYTSTSFWCVDSTGRSIEIATDKPADVIKGTSQTEYSCK